MQLISSGHPKASMPLIKKGILLLSIALLLLLGVAPVAVSSASTNELRIDENFDIATINEVSNRFIAPQSASYFDVLQPNGASSSEDITSNQNSRLWLSTELVNTGFSSVPLVLNIDRLNLDDLQIYLLDNNARITKSYRYQAGKGDYSLKKLLPSIRVTFSLSAEERARLLIGVKDEGLREFPIAVWHQQSILQYDKNMRLLIGVVIGILGVLAGYFLLSYLFQRTPSRFWLAMNNGVLMALFFIAQGGLAWWPSLTNASEDVVTLLLGVAFLILAKVTHNLFSRIPLVLRIVTFILPLVMMIWALVSDDYQASIIVMASSALIGIYHVFLALFYRDKRTPGLSRIFVIAWFFFFVLYAILIDTLLGSLLYTTPVVTIILIVLCASLLCLGFCVELKERSFNIQKLLEREATISNLNRFYDLFRNSAEGLYTSTLDGELKTVNPAMCALFGYEDESHMLSAIANTREFYANTEDRDLMVGELLADGIIMGREFKGLKADGSEFWFSISCQVRNAQDGKFLYGSIIDVTEKKHSDLSLQYMVSHDALTGVFNRRHFESTLKNKLATDEIRTITLLYLDLDRFKVVNDTCGHKAGDALIKEVAVLLSDTLPENAMIARLGGDEFGVVIDNEPTEGAHAIAEALLDTVHDYHFMWDKRIFNLGVSIGLVECDDRATPGEQYLSMADAACYFAKEQGRNQIHQYNKDDKSIQRYQKELDWVTAINQAHNDERFVLYYQPLRPLSSPNDGYYYEVLLRLKTPDGNIVKPTAFLPTAERFEMNVKIDKWVLTNTFKWLQKNPEHLANLKRCSINLNCHSLTDRDFKLFVLNAFDRYGIPYHKICFEVIESVAIIKMEDTVGFMQTFNELGCSFALDDFGSGFSSYSYLKHLPVDIVKIDGAFIKDMLTDPVDAAMVASIKDVAKAMGMQTVAEFVESDATMAQLGKIGIDYAQGFGVAHPSPLNEFTPL